MPKLRLPACCAVLLFVVAMLGSSAGAAPSADSVGTLQLNGTFKNAFSAASCPAGSPQTTQCYREVNVADLIPGLGKVTVDYTLLQDDFGSACGHVHAQMALVVEGKGVVDLATKTTGCIASDNPAGFPPLEVVVAGGSGRYAGATGGGTMLYHNSESGGGTGHSTIAWTGTLNVDGLSFDTTPPQVTGANAKTVTTRAGAGTRVRYAVTASDAVDGVVSAVCSPRSGSVFGLGRTIVRCSAVDGSGNTAAAPFFVTVKRVHR